MHTKFNFRKVTKSDFLAKLRAISIYRWIAIVSVTMLVILVAIIIWYFTGSKHTTTTATGNKIISPVVTNIDYYLATMQDVGLVINKDGQLGESTSIGDKFKFIPLGGATFKIEHQSGLHLGIFVTNGKRSLGVMQSPSVFTVTSACADKVSLSLQDSAITRDNGHFIVTDTPKQSTGLQVFVSKVSVPTQAAPTQAAPTQAAPTQPPFTRPVMLPVRNGANYIVRYKNKWNMYVNTTENGNIEFTGNYSKFQFIKVGDPGLFKIKTNGVFLTTGPAETGPAEKSHVTISGGSEDKALLFIVKRVSDNIISVSTTDHTLSIADGKLVATPREPGTMTNTPIELYVTESA
jgi:hypothetical protein